MSNPQQFNSRFYNPQLPKWRIYQDYVLQKLGWFAAAWMLLMLYRLFGNTEMLAFGLVSFAVAIALAYIAAAIEMGALPAEIVFSGNAFAITSVRDKLQGGAAPDYFPTAYSAIRTSNTQEAHRVMIHYHDRVLYLAEADWPDFYQIVDRLRFAEPLPADAEGA